MWVKIPTPKRQRVGEVDEDYFIPTPCKMLTVYYFYNDGLKE